MTQDIFHWRDSSSQLSTWCTPSACSPLPSAGWDLSCSRHRRCWLPPSSSVTAAPAMEWRTHYVLPEACKKAISIMFDLRQRLPKWRRTRLESIRTIRNSLNSIDALLKSSNKMCDPPLILKERHARCMSGWCVYSATLCNTRTSTFLPTTSGGFRSPVSYQTSATSTSQYLR